MAGLFILSLQHQMIVQYCALDALRLPTSTTYLFSGDLVLCQKDFPVITSTDFFNDIVVILYSKGLGLYITHSMNARL